MHSDPQHVIDRCERVLREWVLPLIHTTLRPVAMESWEVVGEPVGVAAGIAGVREAGVPFETGSAWGGVWTTTWFRVEGTVPADSGSAGDGPVVELVLDLGWFDHSVGGHVEGMVYRADGTAIKGLHPRNGWVRLAGPGAAPGVVGPGGRFELFVEAAANPLLLGLPPFVETPLGAQVEQHATEPYVLRRADVCAFDDEVWQLARDLEVACGLAQRLDSAEPRYWRLLRAVEAALDAYDDQDVATATAARAELSGVLAQPAHASAHEMTAVGHAHIDSAWLWPVRETRRKVGRTVANVLALLDLDDEVVYTMSAALHFEWLEERHPDLYERVRKAVQEGRIVPVGGMWIEPDSVMPTGEALVRQLSYGTRYFQERFGHRAREVWLPDSFGYSGALPQLARRAGFRWFLTQKISWNDTTTFPHHSFLWEGIDGTRIFTHFPPADTYAAEITAAELSHAVANFRDKAVASHSLLVYGYGDGGGGPTREMVARGHRFADLEGAPRVVVRTPEEFFTLAESEIRAARGPVWSGELYLELHRGTLTTQAATKQSNRRNEALLRTVEYLSVVAALGAGLPYPARELEGLWKTVLLNQFHDILPGTSIAWVHREAEADHEAVTREALGLARRAVDALGLPAGGPGALVHVGRTRAEDWHVTRSHAATRHAPTALSRDDRGDVVLDNGLLRTVIDADGHVTSLLDLSTGRELVPRGERLGVLQLFRDEPVRWDAWDIDRHSLRHPVELRDAVSVETVACDDHAGVVVERRHGKSVYRISVTLRSGSAQLDFGCEVDWQERDRLLKVALPTAISPRTASFETQYGVVERPVHDNTAHDEAQFEVSTHRFVHLAEPGYGIGVVNDSTYGADVRPVEGDGHGNARGTTVRLSLLRSPRFPDPDADRGRHRFRWAVLPSPDPRATLAAAAAINAPILDELPDVAPLLRLELDSGTAVIDWVKLADDGSGDVVARVYEPFGGRATARLRPGPLLAGASVRETDLLETEPLEPGLSRALGDDDTRPAADAPLDLGPYQVATLRLHPNHT
ncbi:alpha-mannosidase [Promicromonospora panici]|uniref:alpha-mannosidase n=1 Tax=Promicromonospora panici TaxID=2219658 RepID=UPI00101CB7AB|nr:glycoside hydrolase family 38 C-terminal domain-containing protein [Promicromonospora panici]